jgi:mRNA-degrading endonuclease RelE of RelBE toxin-antitoxin system
MWCRIRSSSLAKPIASSETCHHRFNSGSNHESTPWPQRLVLMDLKKLSGADQLYRIRVGDYRIVYAVEDDRLLVLVVKVGHRREVYR